MCVCVCAGEWVCGFFFICATVLTKSQVFSSHRRYSYQASRESLRFQIRTRAVSMISLFSVQFLVVDTFGVINAVANFAAPIHFHVWLGSMKSRCNCITQLNHAIPSFCSHCRECCHSTSGRAFPTTDIKGIHA